MKISITRGNTGSSHHLQSHIPAHPWRWNCCSQGWKVNWFRELRLALRLHNRWIWIKRRSISTWLETEGERSGGPGNPFQWQPALTLALMYCEITFTLSHSCIRTTVLDTTSLFCSKIASTPEWNVLKHLTWEILSSLASANHEF